MGIRRLQYLSEIESWEVLRKGKHSCFNEIEDIVKIMECGSRRPKGHRLIASQKTEWEGPAALGST